PEPRNRVDRWLFSRLRKTLAQVEKDYETYDYRPVAQHLYDFLWSDYCDWYLEALKIRLYGNPAQKEDALQQGLYALSYLLQALHPLIPFLTEALWQQFPFTSKGLLQETPWKVPPWDFPKEEGWFENIRSACKAIRGMKRDLDIPITQKSTVYIHPLPAEEDKSLIEKLAWVEVKAGEHFSALALEEKIHPWHLVHPVPDKGQIVKKIQEINQALVKIQEKKNKLSQILRDEKFQFSAPAHIQENFRSQLRSAEEEEKELKRKWERLSTTLK
ncbi:MAG: class I tRNA ligase family protein, partial [bacterium]